MAPWLAVVEAWLVQRLLQSPSFHHAVRKVHKNVHRMRHGSIEGDLGGTNIEKQGPGFVNHFWDEIRSQAGRGDKKLQDPLQKHDYPPPPPATAATQPTRNTPAQESEKPNEGFLNYFINELRSQMRGGDKNR